jgi:hypothetical protein
MSNLSLAHGYAREGPKAPIEPQVEAVTNYYRARLAGIGVALAGVYQDGGSASASLPFHERPAGQALLERLRPGDHIVISSLSRAWISMDDAIKTVEMIKAREATIHIVGFPRVEMLETLKFWRSWQNELTVEKFKIRRPAVGPKGVPTVGWKLARNKRDLEPDEHDRSCIALALQLHSQGKTLDHIVVFFRAHRIYTSKLKLWGRARIYSGMLAYKKNLWKAVPFDHKPKEILT